MTSSTVGRRRISAALCAAVLGWGSASLHVRAQTAHEPPNLALGSMGGVATPSSTYPGYAASYVNDGNPWTIWASANAGDYPHRIKVDWGRLEAISRVDVHTPAGLGLVAFRVQYWVDQGYWADVQGGSVTDNQLAVLTFSFPAVTTRAVRLLITATADGYSRVGELAAYTVPPPPPPPPPPTSPTPPTPDIPPAAKNVALASNGGIGAGSVTDPIHPAADVNDGNTGTMWASAFAFDYPHRIKVDWGELRTIDRVRVQMRAGSVLAAFTMQYWIDNAGWHDLPGGVVTQNQLAVVNLTFPPLYTRAVRLLITSAAADGISRVAELEAFEPSLPAGGGTPSARSFKVGYWNLQYGTGTSAMPNMGGQCEAAPQNQYGSQTWLNAWGTGHVQAYLDRHIKADTEIIAFGGSEVANAYAMSAAAISAHLNWPVINQREEVLLARHGFRYWEGRNLPVCGPESFGMGALYGQVWRTADGARTDDYVHVFSTHFRHPDAGTCGGDPQGIALRQWIAEVARDGRPIVVIGDLNTIVEDAVDPKIQAFGWYQSVLMPHHMEAWRQAGFVDAYRTVYPSTATHPGMTSTWHGGPYYGGLWKRIDYALVKGAMVTGAQLFNTRTEGNGSVYNCTPSDHAGIIVTAASP